VVSISTASLLEVVFRHFRASLDWFPSNPSSASNLWKSVGSLVHVWHASSMWVAGMELDHCGGLAIIMFAGNDGQCDKLQ